MSSKSSSTCGYLKTHLHDFHFLLSIDFADKKAAYTIVDSFYAENASLSQYILQYNTVPADIDDTKFVAGLGDTTTDQLGKFHSIICITFAP